MAFGTVATVDLSALEPVLEGLSVRRITFDRSLKETDVYLRAKTLECFDLGRAPDGTPWAPLKRPRVRPRDKRARGGTGQKPLRDTGVLMASATSGAVAILDAMSIELRQGSNLDYAAIHNFGGTISYPERTRAKPWVWKTPEGRTVFTRKIKAHTVTIPARPFTGVTEAMAERIGQFVVDDVLRQLGLS